MLRPRVRKVNLGRGARRYVFCLQRPNGDRRLLVHFDVERVKWDDNFHVTGVTFEAKLFGPR